MKYLTNQEAFDIVVRHMATQNKKSIRTVGGKETCAYRGGDELKGYYFPNIKSIVSK